MHLDKDGIYKALRKELADEMTRTAWVNKSSSGDSAFNHLCEYAMDHKALTNLKPKWLEKASEDSIKIQAALAHLIADLSQKRKRIDKRHDEALESAIDDERYYKMVFKSWEALGMPCRPAIIVHVIDPEKATAIPSDTYRPYDWYGIASLMPFTGILDVLSMYDLAALVLKRVPPAAPGGPERAVRAFYGAMSNSAPRGQAAYPPDPEYVQIGDSEELEGWLRATEAKPLRLCAVLHRPSAIVAGPTQRPQTPSLEGWDYLTEDDINDIELME